MINTISSAIPNVDMATQTTQTSKKRKYDQFILHEGDPLAAIQTKARKIQRVDRPSETDLKVETFVISSKTSPFSSYVDQFEEPIKEEVRQLEDLLKEKDYSLVQRRHIRTLVIHIHDQYEWSENRKLAEICLLYFMLANSDSIPKKALSFVEQQAQELEHCIKNLKQEHKSISEAVVDKPLTSGSVNYLRRFFVRIIYCFGRGFNFGGCYAVLELLKTPVSLLLTEEQKQQIETVIERFINIPKFRELFEEIGDIHPDMQEYIRLDEQLSKNLSIRAIHVQWALLSTLFYLPFQRGEGNCYAVASEMNIQRQNPDLFLLLLKEILRKGTFTFEDKEIPITSLLSFTHNDENESMITEKVSTLNLLSRSMLALLQFISLNSNKIRYIEGKEKSSHKNWIVKVFENVISDFLSDIIDDDSSRSFKKKFSNVIADALYIFDYLDSSSKFKNKRIFYKHHERGFILKRKLSDYAPFQKIRRLFYLKENELKPIDSISNLGSYFFENVNKFEHSNTSNDFNLIIYVLKNYFKMEAFKQKVAQQLSRINSNKAHLTWKEYYESDSFFWIGEGGDCGLIVDSNPININNRYTTPVSFKATKLSNLFQSLILKIIEHEKSYDKNFAKDQNAFLLFSSQTHTFNLTPWSFREFLSVKSAFNNLSNLIYYPGDLQLSRYPTEEQKQRILCQTFEKLKGKLVYLKVLTSCAGLNFKDFRQKIKSFVPYDFHEKFNSAFARVIEEISVEQLNINFPFILEEHAIVINSEMRQKISKYLENKKGKNTCLSPYEAASLLQKALVLNGFPFIQKHELEKIIRSKFALPQVINLGNLNWVKKLEEKPPYSYCILKYDYKREDLNMYERIKEDDTPFDSKFIYAFYEMMEIFFES